MLSEECTTIEDNIKLHQQVLGELQSDIMDQALASMRGAIIRSIDNQIVTLNSQIKSLRQTEMCIRDRCRD